MLDQFNLDGKSAKQAFSELAQKQQTWSDVLNYYLFFTDNSEFKELQHARNSTLVKLIQMRDDLDVLFYSKAIEMIFPNEFFNIQQTVPEIGKYNFRVMRRDCELDKPYFEISIHAPGSRNLTSDIDTTVNVACMLSKEELQQESNVSYLRNIAIFSSLIATKSYAAYIQALVQAEIIKNFNELNHLELGLTGANSRDTNAYATGLIAKEGYRKFTNDETLIFAKLVTDQPLQDYYAEFKAEKEQLEFAASLLPLREFYAVSGQDWNDFEAKLMRSCSVPESARTQCLGHLRSVLERVEKLYRYKESQIDTEKNIKKTNSTHSKFKLHSKLNNGSKSYEEDYLIYVKHILYVKHLCSVASVLLEIEQQKDKIVKMVQAIKSEEVELETVEKNIQSLNENVSSQKIIEQALSEKIVRENAKKQAKQALDQELKYLASLYNKQQLELVRASLFAHEAYNNYSATHHVVEGLQQAGNLPASAMAKKQIVRGSILHNIGFHLLHNALYQSAELSSGHRLTKVAKYGLRVSEMFFGDDKNYFDPSSLNQRDLQQLPLLPRLKQPESDSIRLTFTPQQLEMMKQDSLLMQVKKSPFIPEEEKGEAAMHAYLQQIYLFMYPHYQDGNIRENDLQSLAAQSLPAKLVKSWLAADESDWIDIAIKIIWLTYTAQLQQKNRLWGSGLFGKNLPLQKVTESVSASESSEIDDYQLPFKESFIGRKKQLAELMQAISECDKNNFANCHVITGRRGMGKSALAIHLGHVLQEEKIIHQIYFFADAGSEHFVAKLYALALRLDIDVSKLSKKDLAQQIYRTLEQKYPNKKILFIFDSVNRAADIKEFLPPVNSKVQILITSYDENWDHKRFHILPRLSVFNKEEVREYLGLYPALGQVNENDIELLSNHFNDSVLMLAKHVNTICNRGQGQRIEEYTDNFFSLQQEKDVSSDEEVSMKEVWKEFCEHCNKTNIPSAITLMQCCAILNCEVLSEKFLIRLFHDVRKSENEHFSEVKLAMMRYLLSRESSGRLTLHDILRETISRRITVENSLANINLLIKFFIDWLSQDKESRFDQDYAMLAIEVANIALSHIDKHADKVNIDKIIIFIMLIAKYLSKYGFYLWATETLKSAYEVSEKQLISNHKTKLDLSLQFGSELRQAGKYVEAYHIFIELEKLVTNLALNKLAMTEIVADIHKHLGILYEDMGLFTRSLRILALARDKFQSITPRTKENDLSLAETLFHIGVTYRELGDYEEARGNFSEALTIREKCLGSRDLKTQYTKVTLASALDISQQLPRAQQMMEEALAIQLSIQADHPLVAITKTYLGTVLNCSGHSPAAEKMYEEALNIAQKTFGKHHRNVSIMLYNRAWAKYAQGNFIGAEQDALQAYKIYQRNYDESHEKLPKEEGDYYKHYYLAYYSQLVLGHVYMAQKKIDQAFTSFKAALKVCSNKPPFSSFIFSHKLISAPSLSLRMSENDFDALSGLLCLIYGPESDSEKFYQQSCQRSQMKNSKNF